MSCLRRYYGSLFLVFFDNIFVYSLTHEEHWNHLEMVFGILRDIQLVIKREKCSLAKEEVRYLGHIICVWGRGVKADPKKHRHYANMAPTEECEGVGGIFRANGVLPSFHCWLWTHSSAVD